MNNDFEAWWNEHEDEMLDLSSYPKKLAYEAWLAAVVSMGQE